MALALRFTHVMFPPSLSRLLLFCAFICASALDVLAQAPPAPAPPSPVPALAPRHEAEQNLVNLPTTQPLHRFGSHFRLTHRFARDLRHGGVGELASNLFGLDNGAVIGLDYRFAPLSNVQVGVYRSMVQRTIQFSGRTDAWRQSAQLPLSLSVVSSVEGTNNMRDDYAPGVGLVASHEFGQAVAAYVTPMFVWNTSAAHDAEAADGREGRDAGTGPSPFDDGHRNTAYVGMGARVRVRPTAYVVGEYAPRVAGHSPPGRGTWGVALEKQTRGHVFQINLTNSFGTTYGQTALGGERSNIYLGFNLGRKF